MSAWHSIGRAADGWTVYHHRLVYDARGRDLIEHITPTVTGIATQRAAIEAANELAATASAGL